MTKVLRLFIWLAAVVKVSALSLRSSSAKYDEADGDAKPLRSTTGFGGATFNINHISSDGGWDDDTVSKAFVDAYNSVHQANGFTITKAFIDKSIVLPGDGTSESTVKIGRSTDSALKTDWSHYNSVSWCTFTYECSGETCSSSNPNEPPPLSSVLTGSHDALENEFKNNLMYSGWTGFREISSATIDFTYDLGQPKPNKLSWNPNLEQAMVELSTEVEFHGVIEEPDGSPDTNLKSDRFAVLAESVVAAYNEAHPDLSWEMRDMHIERVIEVPEDNDDDVASNGMMSKKGKISKYDYSSGRGSWYCRLCPPNLISEVAQGSIDASSAVAIMPPDRHEAYQTILCRKLKSSGVREYSRVHSCKVRFSTADFDGPDHSFASAA